MTKKDFRLIAGVISLNLENSDNSPSDIALLNQIAKDFATVLPATNPQFDRERFLTACGVEDK